MGDANVIRMIDSRGPTFGWWVLVGALAAAGTALVVLAGSGGAKAVASVVLLTDAAIVLSAFVVHGGFRGGPGVAVTGEGLRSRFWSIDWSVSKALRCGVRSAGAFSQFGREQRAQFDSTGRIGFSASCSGRS